MPLYESLGAGSPSKEGLYIWPPSPSRLEFFPLLSNSLHCTASRLCLLKSYLDLSSFSSTVLYISIAILMVSFALPAVDQLDDGVDNRSPSCALRSLAIAC